MAFSRAWNGNRCGRRAIGPAPATRVGRRPPAKLCPAKLCRRGGRCDCRRLFRAGGCAMPAPQIDIKAAATNPSRYFKAPGDVLRHPGLSRKAKIDILRQWETDARLMA